MGKIIVSENVSLDGSVEDPTGSQGSSFGGWFGRTAGKDLQAWTTAEVEEAMGAEALLLGRRSYEWFMALGWASREGAWADRLRAVPKYVVSATLQDLPWDNTTVLTGDAVKSVSALKHEVNGEIVVYGSGRLVHTLLEHDLVDELRLMVFPFVVGAGERLFSQPADRKDLRLVGNRTVGEGIALLTYRPARDA
jgi:dihydrofolate reductase